MINLRRLLRNAVVGILGLLIFGSSHAFSQNADRRTRGWELFDQAQRCQVDAGCKNAVTYYEQALRLFDEKKEVPGQKAVLTNLILILINQDTVPASVAGYADRLIGLSRDSDDPATERWALTHRALLYGQAENYAEAERLYLKVADLSKAANDSQAEAQAWISLARINEHLDRLDKAYNYFQLAENEAREAKDSAVELEALLGRGEILVKRQEFAKAIVALERALGLANTPDQRISAMVAMRNLGMAYQSLLDGTKATEYLEKALALARLEKDDEEIAMIETLLSSIPKMSTESIGNAGNANEQQKTVSTMADDSEARLRVLSKTIFQSIQNNEEERLEADLAQAVELSRQLKSSEMEALFLILRIPLLIAADRLEETAKVAERSFALGSASNNLEIKIQALFGLAAIANGNDRQRLAVFYGKLALSGNQRARQEARGVQIETQKLFLSRRVGFYRRLAGLLISANRAEEAVEILNAYKDEQLFDSSVNSGVVTAASFTFTPREKELYLKFEILTNELQTLTKLQSDAADSNKLGISKKIALATDNLTELHGQAATEFSGPLDAKDKAGPIGAVKDMQNALNSISRSSGSEAVALHQLVDEEIMRSILITGSKVVASSTEIESESLNAKARQFWGLLQSDRYDASLLSKELYDVVFKPIEKELPKDTKTILWSLDGNLRYVPMGALFDGKQYLAERYNHVNFTRADAERMTRPVSSKWTATGLGTSKQHTVSLLGDSISFDALPGVTAEFEQLFKPSGKAGLLDGQVLRDAAFDQKSMLEQMKLKRPVVHIASHFSFRPGDETRSFLLMGDGSAFTLADMKKETNMFAGVELLTLSACNTAAQQADANGREIDGFAELAQRLGANSVMATLWPVADASTPWLMREFYSGKLDRKLSKAESLRQAQFALLRGVGENGPVVRTRNSSTPTEDVVVVTKDGKPPANAVRGAKLYLSESDAPLYDSTGKPPFAHPHYWAPFILFGNWQ